MKTVIAMVIALFLIMAVTTNQELFKKQKELFPKLLWTFWDGDLNDENSQIFIKLCFYNMKHYSAISGWQFNLVTFNNLPQHLNKQNYEKCTELLGFVNQNFKQTRADIIRLFLLKEHGGMWVDASTFFVGNLGWINNITNSYLPIVNKLNFQPDFISFRLAGYDKPDSKVWDQDMKREVIISPGIENWAMISKKNTLFVNDALKVIQNMTYKGQQTIINQAIKDGIVLAQLAKNSYFKFGIQTFQLVLQYKQKQLDQKKTKILQSNHSLDLNPKYAVEFYKIWTIESIVMGFNLQHFTDGLLPFLSVLYLYSSNKDIEYFDLKLIGFIKLGGVKRKYIEIMLEYMVNPSFMCLVNFHDAFKLTYQSFLYNYMIKDNSDPTGLVLKDHIQNIDQFQIKRQQTCQISQQKQMGLIQDIIDNVLLIVYFFIFALLIVFGIWIKCNNLVELHTKGMIYFFVTTLILLTIMYQTLNYKSQTKNTSIYHPACSKIQFVIDSQEKRQNQNYFMQLRDQLPRDNSKIFQMFFLQFIQKIQGNFSSFVSKNKFQYFLYFSKPIWGIILCFLFFIGHRFCVFGKLAKKVNQKSERKIFFLILALFVLSAVLLLSFKALSNAFELHQSIKKSTCFLIQIPRHFSNSSQLFKNVQSNGVNYIELFQIINNAFKKIFLLIMGRVRFQQKTSKYLNQLVDIKMLLSFNLQNRQLIKMIQNKQKLLIETKQKTVGVANNLVCENRVMYLCNFFIKNIFDLIGKVIFFFNNHIQLSDFSLIFSALPFAISLIFCFVSAIILIKSANNYRKQNEKMSLRKYRPTLALLLVLSFIISFSFQGIIVINYYFCDFVSNYKDSLKNSNTVINFVPDSCTNQVIKDLFKKDLKQIFRMRKQPLKQFLNLQQCMNMVINFPYNQQKQLISKISSEGYSQLINFQNLTNDYNLFLKRYAEQYFKNRIEIRNIVQNQYATPQNIDLTQNLQNMLFQPICVFNFNVLYQMTYTFRYFGYIYLLALLITFVTQSQTIQIADKISQFETIDFIQMQQKSQQDTNEKQKYNNNIIKSKTENNSNETDLN